MKVSDCRHCGGLAKIRSIRHRGRTACHYIECLNCGISTRRYPTLAEAVAVWNRRPEDRLPEGLQNAVTHSKSPILPLDPRARAEDPAAPYAFNTLTGRYYYSNEAIEAHNQRIEDITAEDFLSDYRLQGG